MSLFICLFTFVSFLSFSDTYMKLSCQEIPQKSVSQHGTSKKIINSKGDPTVLAGELNHAIIHIGHRSKNLTKSAASSTLQFK